MRAAWIALVLMVLLAGNALAGRFINGVVRAVYDGDTLLLATKEQSRLKVRMYGIDAPETTKTDMPEQPFGAVARRTLMYKVMGRHVSAEVMDTDQYHRTVAVIRYNGRDINREMVAEGLAWAYRQYLHGPYASGYLDSEATARSRHKGLWSETNPLPPWEFRHALDGGKKHRNRH